MEYPRPPSLCRICLMDGASVPIFETKDTSDPDVFAKLCQCVGETMVEDLAGFPRSLCWLCYDSLNVAWQFITEYKISTETLMKRTQLALAEQEIWEEQYNQTDDCYNDIKIESPMDSDCDAGYSKHDNGISEVGQIYIFGCESSNDLSSMKNDIKIASSDDKESNSSLKRLSSSPKGSKKLKANVKVNKKQNNSTKKIKSENNVDNTKHLCDLCGQTFPDRTRLLTHRNRKHSSQYQCAECHKTFKCKNYISAHIRRFHSTQCAIRNVIRKPCTICGKQFNATNLKRHISSVHRGERREVCTVCGKAFAHKHHLNSHMNIHTGERPVKCPICQLGFIQSSQMKSHIKHNHRISQLDAATVEALSKLKYNYMKLMIP